MIIIIARWTKFRLEWNFRTDREFSTRQTNCIFISQSIVDGRLTHCRNRSSNVLTLTPAIVCINVCIRNYRAAIHFTTTHYARTPNILPRSLHINPRSRLQHKQTKCLHMCHWFKRPKQSSIGAKTLLDTPLLLCSSKSHNNP